MAPKYSLRDEIQSTSAPSQNSMTMEACEVHAGVIWYRLSWGHLRMPVPEG